MIRRENVIKRFIMGMSVLTAYIYYTGNLNMHDINISAEQFMCDLLNILYNMDLKNANSVTYNNSGYDLISENKKIIIQVTVTDTPEKIIRTLNTIKHKVFEYSEWTEKLREIRVRKKLDPSTYTSKVQDDEKKIRSKLAENVNLNDYTLYFMVMQQDATMQRKYKGECEFPYKSRVMGTSEPLKPLKAPYMARNPVKWGFFRLKGQEIPLKI